MKKELFVKHIPLLLSGLLILVGLVTVFTEAGSYGITWDEPSQENYGLVALNWYQTLGRDTTVMTYDSYVQAHGVIFDVIVTAVQEHFPPADHWQIRHTLTALLGLLGIVIIALCGYELGGYWVAFLAALALWLYPRYYGAIYNNPKDVPALVTTTFVLWTVLLFIRQWKEKKAFIRNCILVGFALGLATAIRVNSIIWLPLLILVLAVGWLFQGKRLMQEKRVRSELVKQALALGIIAVTALLVTMALWPYIFVSPFVNFYNAIEILAHYPWDGPVLFGGKMIPAEQLPASYIPIWLAIDSPPALLLFACAGLIISCVLCFKKHPVAPKIAIILLSLITPLAAILILHAVVYDGPRQFLFLVPPIILIAAYGFVQSTAYLARRKQQTLRILAAGIAIATLTSYGFVVEDML